MDIDLSNLKAAAATEIRAALKRTGDRDLVLLFDLWLSCEILTPAFNTGTITPEGRAALLKTAHDLESILKARGVEIIAIDEEALP